MNIIIFRYSPRVVMMNHIQEDSVVIAPETQREKYKDFEAQGFHVKNVNFISDFTLPEIIRFIRKISYTHSIESITTLSEEDMDWVGLLHDHFVLGNSSFASNTLFKDKYYMRAFLIDQVNQPKFRLVEKKADLDEFWKDYEGDQAIIKPRFGAGSQGVMKIHRGDSNFENIDNIFSGNFLIEGFINLDNMFTCDGYSVGSNIVRFFSHEYDELLLDSLSSSFDLVVRTNSNYWKNKEMIWKAFQESEKVLQIFSIKNQITPFHFEWFVNILSGEMFFCEVGKRFGGANIPFIINYAFGIDILQEYWKNPQTNGSHLSIIKTKEELPQPKLIAATYCPYTKSGKLISVPDHSLFDWTKSTWFFVNLGTETKPSSSIVENLFLSEFVSKSENDYKNNLEKLRNLRNQFKYEVIA